MQQGLFRASGMVTHHHRTVQTTLSSTLDYQAGGSLLVSTGGSLLESAEVLVLHYADLPDSDVRTAQGFKFTRPLRTILDLIETGTVERNFIRQALKQAVDRGLITRQQ